MNDKALAKQVYNQQVENNWPGLAAETKEICERLKISDINTTPFDKSELKDAIKKATKREDEQEMREQKANNERKDTKGRNRRRTAATKIGKRSVEKRKNDEEIQDLKDKNGEKAKID